MLSVDRDGSTFRKAALLFDLVNGEDISFDKEGTALSDLQAVQEEAALALAALVKELRSVPRLELPCALAVEVRDNGGPVLKVQFTFETHQLQ